MVQKKNERKLKIFPDNHNHNNVVGRPAGRLQMFCHLYIYIVFIMMFSIKKNSLSLYIEGQFIFTL